MNGSGMQKLKYFLLGVAVTAVAFLLIRQAVQWLPVSSYVSDPTSADAAKKTRQIRETMDQYYLGEIDDQKLADYMYLGLVTGLEDPYSTYYTKSEYETVSMNQQGDYRGVGITISPREEGGVMIAELTKGGPAEQAGLLPGDIILAIDGTDLSGADVSAVSAMVRQTEADSIEIKILREETGEELTFTVAIATLEAYSVNYGMTEDQIGYIYISSFTAHTAAQFAEARKALEEQGMKALIVDLRDNQGGLVVAVHELLNSIMPEGLLFYTEDKNGSGKEYYSTGESVLEVPMAVLVGSNTASAAEIFAGAVKDYQTGTLIGTVTYGKGIVQDVFTLDDGSVIRLTISHYYTPNGTDIHLHGITPDIEIVNTETEDLQFEKAVEILTAETELDQAG